MKFINRSGRKVLRKDRKEYVFPLRSLLFDFACFAVKKNI
jgi:hypothetical protein